MLLELYLSFFKVGLFAIGGGYATLPLISDEAIAVHHWITQQDFINLVTISQMTPGPIAINAASFVGMKVAGISGAVIATLGCISPSLVIVSLIAWLYRKLKGNVWFDTVLATLCPAVVGLILYAGIDLLLQAVYPQGRVDWLSLVLFGLSFALLRTKKFGSVTTMLLAGAAMLVLYVIMGPGLLVPGV